MSKEPGKGEAQGTEMNSEQVNTMKLVIFLVKNFDLEEKKAKEVAEELQETMEIYSSDDLKLTTISELEQNLTTLSSAEKERFLDHVRKMKSMTGSSQVKRSQVKKRQVKRSQVKTIDDLLVDFSQPLRDNRKVYKGWKTHKGGVDDIPVAVKILDIIKGGCDKWPEQYLQEINNMISLHHNHIVQFVVCGEMDNNPKSIYIATRLCHDKTLYDIDLSALVMQQKIYIILQIGDALKFIHSKNIAHRDLKPTNILFTEDGKRVVVCDFGISRNVNIDSERGTITQGNFEGSLGWAPSEVSRGDKELDFFKADIFSFGLLGHFVICDKIHAFSDSNKPNPAEQKSSNSGLRDVPPMDELSELTPEHLHLYILAKYEPAFTALRKMNDGCLAIDLFRKLLSHYPKKRPNIEEVLRHYLFWDCFKKVQFFKDMLTSFIDRKKCRLDETGTEEQKYAFTYLGPRKTAQIDDGNPPTLTSSPPSGDTYIPSIPEIEKLNSSVADTTVSFSASSTDEEDHLKWKCIPEETLEVISPDWLSRITGDNECLTAWKSKRDEEAYDNSLDELIRYIRNHHEHRYMQEDLKNRSELTWKFFSRLFPELLPYVFRIMEPSFCVGHEATKKYKNCAAKIEEVDLSHVLRSVQSR